MISDFDNGKTNFYAYFRGLVNEIGIIGVLNKYDINDIDTYFETNNIKFEEYKLFVSLLEKDSNLVMKYALENKKLFDSIFENMDSLYSLFYDLNIDIVRKILEQIKLSNYKYSPIFISGINKEIKKEIINELDTKTILYFMDYIDPDVLTIYLNNNPDIEVISDIPLEKLFEIKLPLSVLNSDIIFEKLKSYSLVEVRSRIEKLKEKNPSLIIEEKFERYIEKIISSFKIEENILEIYSNINEENINDIFLKSNDKYLLSYVEMHNLDIKDLKSSFQKITNQKLKELVLDYLFKDNWYNIKLNIAEILRYQNNSRTLTDDEIIMYDKFYNIDKLSNIEIIELWTKYKNSDLSKKFYLDIRKAKDNAYENMINGLIDIKTLSKKNYKDVEVYELDGKPFSMMIRGIGSFNENIGIKRNCYSLINNFNLSISGGYNFYYGYNNIKKENIAHVYENDSFSSIYLSNNINRIMTSKEINDVSGYSEIQIQNEKINGEYIPLIPSYLVVFDDIEERHIEEAKRLNIPIVKIDKTKYTEFSNNKSHMFDTNVYDGYKYINSEKDEFEVKHYKK